MQKKALMIMLYYQLSEKGLIKSFQSKFDGQISALTRLGYEVTYYITTDSEIYKVTGDRKEFVKRRRLFSISKLSHLYARYEVMRIATKEALHNRFDIVYIRSSSMIPYFAKMTNKLSAHGDRVVVEIPTYPPKKEILIETRWWLRMASWYIEKVERKASKYVSLYTLIGDKADQYLNRPAINILNGTNVAGYPMHRTRPDDGTIHILALGTMRNYHGFDRIINAMKEYYRLGNATKVFLHLVGPDGDGSLQSWKELSEDLGLKDYVFIEGEKTGKDLDRIFDACDVACSSLGCFRKNMHAELDLKTAEYCSRGIPFISCHISTNDSLKIPYNYDDVSEDETPIILEEIINFIQKTKKIPTVAEEMREYAETLSWDEQFKKVLSKLDKL